MESSGWYREESKMPSPLIPLPRTLLSFKKYLDWVLLDFSVVKYVIVTCCTIQNKYKDNDLIPTLPSSWLPWGNHS